jgi:cell division protease FtsH
MIEEKKLLTAYHESGQADAGLNVVATDPIHKATIIPRGHVVTLALPIF